VNALTRAIERIEPKTQAELARRLSSHLGKRVTPQQVNAWFSRGWAAPRYAPAIEHLTGVTCAELVSDIPDKDEEKH
jgi:DNA-binding transcriptional regulator YdaS (Cro superfamily)